MQDVSYTRHPSSPTRRVGFLRFYRSAGSSTITRTQDRRDLAGDEDTIIAAETGPDDLDDLLDRADAALYRAKRRGRNRLAT